METKFSIKNLRIEDKLYTPTNKNLIKPPSLFPGDAPVYASWYQTIYLIWSNNYLCALRLRKFNCLLPYLFQILQIEMGK